MMILPDHINGLFEVGGAAFLLFLNVQRMHADRELKGARRGGSLPIEFAHALEGPRECEDQIAERLAFTIKNPVSKRPLFSK